MRILHGASASAGGATRRRTTSSPTCTCCRQGSASRSCPTSSRRPPSASAGGPSWAAPTDSQPTIYHNDNRVINVAAQMNLTPFTRSHMSWRQLGHACTRHRSGWGKLPSGCDAAAAAMAAAITCEGGCVASTGVDDVSSRGRGRSSPQRSRRPLHESTSTGPGLSAQLLQLVHHACRPANYAFFFVFFLLAAVVAAGVRLLLGAAAACACCW